MSFLVRDARAEDLQVVGQLAGRLVRMHHDYDSARWLLVDGVEAGYARFLASELGQAHTIILVAEDEATGEIVGYSYASLEDRSWADLRDACDHRPSRGDAA